MRIDVGRKSYNLNLNHFAGLIIVSFFFFYSAIDMDYNTAFVDEAIYATVGEGVLLGIFWENALTWMSGSYIYPVVSAMINREFGLYGIRMFSLICIVTTGLISSYIGSKLGGTKVAIWTLLFYFSTSVVLDLAQLGTYDSLAFLFFALSLHLIQIANNKERLLKWSLLLLSAIFASFSVLTKYIFIILIPVLALFLLTNRRYANILWNIAYTTFWSCATLVIIIFFVIANHEALLSFFTSGAFSEPKQRMFILSEGLKMLVIQSIGVLGSVLILLSKMSNKKKTIIFLLIISGLMPLAYHIGSANFRSMWKHMAISAFFWSPLAGFFAYKLLAVLSKFNKKYTFAKNIYNFSFIFLLVIIVANLWTNIQNHWKFQRSWPSANKVIDYLRANRKSDARILAEGGAVYKYHLFDGFYDPASWTSTWYADYNGKQGVEAMQAAIEDQYFDFIILNYYYTIDVNKSLEPTISKNYNLVLTDNYKISGAYDNRTFLWVPNEKSTE